MNLKPDDLNVFRLVAESQSVTRAAQELQMAQQSVSDRIRVLERVIGEPLFVRSSRGMELTAAGRRLLPYAERCLSLLDEAVSVARSADRGETTNVLVHQAWQRSLASWAEHLGRFSSVDVGRHDGSSSALVTALLVGQADVVVGPIRLHPPEVTSVSLFIDPLVCVIPFGSPLIVETELRMRELLVGDFAARSSTGQECIVTTLWADDDGGGLALSLTDRLPIGAADDGGGPRRWVASFCPRSLVADEIDRNDVIEFDVEGLPPWSIEVVVAFRTADRDLPAIVALYDVLEAASPVLGLSFPGLTRS